MPCFGKEREAAFVGLNTLAYEFSVGWALHRIPFKKKIYRI
jgi:hypothetical protein